MKKKIMSGVILTVFILLLSIGALASEGTVTMFAPDGRQKQVLISNVEIEKSVGWYEGVMMYAPDGREKLVSPFKVQIEKSVGWYEGVRMYAPDGREKLVSPFKVQIEKSVGWYDKRSDVFQLLYAPDGRVKEVTKNKVKENVAVGWSTVPVEPNITEKSENHTFFNGVLHVFGPAQIPYSNDYKNRNDIRTVYVSGSVTSIDDFAFDNCSNLSRVELPDTVTEIGDYSFDDTSITRIGIPASVKSIDPYSFDTYGFNSYSSSANKNMVVYCEKGSAAEAFAIKYKLRYVHATMIYCVKDGKTMMVDANEKNIYLSSGLWNEKPLITMYAPDGREKLVHRDNIEIEKSVGWYENKQDVLVTMYAPDGRQKQVFKAKVAEEKAVGWYDNRNDVIVKMFAPDGRHKEVYKAKIAAEKAVGWYLLDDYLSLLINGQGYEAALNALDNMYSEQTYSTKPNVIDKNTYSAKYKNILNQYYRKIGCPLAVIGWKRTSNSIGTPEITINFRNVSTKTIVAYDQKFTCYDAYGNRTSDYSFYNGDYTGYSTNENIIPGKKFWATWTLYSNEQTHSISWPKVQRVAFSDGTYWYR